MPAPEELSLQLYSLKTQAEKDPAAMLASVASLGYSAVETAGDYGWSIREWRDQLETNAP